MDLSVVTGTYNRLPHAQKMVESVRESVGTGIEYEIVLVDGGSTDGTIEWCKTQPDIVLIEQGELLGAIKAFNEGLFAATGRYCVVGNDDIAYEGDTLPIALAFMEDHPEVGVGCFFQDRDHPGHYSLERMPAILDNKQVQHVYGQVCIVPKWLGDMVGWWGDFEDMRTYGGDNNLSCFVLEMGYKVTGIPCACITDFKVDDELRQINTTQQMSKLTRGHRGHPDSVAWGLHWTHRDGSCGPILRGDRKVESPVKRDTRWLYLPIYEVGHEAQHEQKHGLRDALARHGMVYEMDWEAERSQRGVKYMRNYLIDALEFWKPDVLLTQIHGPDPQGFDAAFVRQLREGYSIPHWVNWNGDYHPEDLMRQDSLDMLKQFDLQCVVTTEVRDAYTKAGVSWMYWQIGYEESDAEPGPGDPHYDVAFLGSGYSNKRLELGRMLRSLPHKVGLYGSWGGGIHVDGYTLYDFDAGQKVYRNSKVSIGDAQWNDRAAGYVSNRLFQALAAGGAMLMHQRVPDLDKLLGLEDGVHYIAWDDLDDLRRKLEHWLNPRRDAHRQAIADAGTEFVLKYHSFDARVEELIEVLGL